MLVVSLAEPPCSIGLPKSGSPNDDSTQAEYNVCNGLNRERRFGGLEGMVRRGNIASQAAIGGMVNSEHRYVESWDLRLVGKVDQRARNV